MADPLRLAVSNIAWESSEDDAVAEVLQREGVGAIEIAPTKWRPDPVDATPREIAAYRRAWADRGLRIVALQSLLFGQPELQLFGATRPRLREHLRCMIDLGAGLGARALVFGSPQNRVRGTLSADDAHSIAVEFFQDVGDYAADRNVVIAIEANPAEYRCDFITTTAEAVALAARVASSGVGVNIDLGGMALAGEEAARVVSSAREKIAHVHISEPYLAEPGTRSAQLDPSGAAADNDGAAAALRQIGYDGWISIEMRANESDRVGAIERAVRFAKARY